jgi:endogenous inhibitor of DNA gyrase (YacG/DUF329 family)
VIDYLDGTLGTAIYCNHTVVVRTISGRQVSSSWCPYHFRRYIQDPSKPRARSEYRKKKPPMVRPKPGGKTVHCQHCRTPFQTRNPRQFLCSEACRRVDRNIKQNAAKAAKAKTTETAEAV